MPSGGKKRDTAWLALRPEKLRIGAERPAEGELNALAGTVFEIGYSGDISIYKLRLADRSLMKVALANTTRDRPSFAVDQLVWVSWLPDAGMVLTR